jgi:pimeloyl-ACP methyl ester carboxylesterase
MIFDKNDRYLTPALGAEIADLFADASVDVVQDAGHWPRRDQPEGVAELLKQREVA